MDCILVQLGGCQRCGAQALLLARIICCDSCRLADGLLPTLLHVTRVEPVSAPSRALFFIPYSVVNPHLSAHGTLWSLLKYALMGISCHGGQ
jgi:hypothetical protein